MQNSDWSSNTEMHGVALVVKDFDACANSSQV